MRFNQANLIKWLKTESSLIFNDEEIPGFHVKRHKNNKSASFIIAYRNMQKITRTYTIGKFPAMGVIEAKTIAAKKYAEIKSGIDIQTEKREASIPSPEDMNVLTLLETYYIPTRLIRRKSGKSAENNIRNHFSSFLKKKISDLNCTHIRDWQNQTKYKNHHHDTMIRILSDFKAMLNFAVKDGVIPSNPIEKCQVIKDTSKKAKQSRTDTRLYLSESQSEAFMKALDMYEDDIRRKRENSRQHGKKYLPSFEGLSFVDRVKPSMLILYYNGMRIGDVITLEWDEVNLEKSNFHFTPNKIAHKKPLPKTFDMNEIVQDALRKWWIQNGKPTSGPVFPNPRTGKAYGKKSFESVWPKIREYAEFPENIELQTLRHNFASQLIMLGVDLFTIADLMATSIKMIEKNYGKLIPEFKKASLNKMIGLAGEKKNPE